MQQVLVSQVTSTIIMKGESFYKGREKETRDIHKWRRTICKKSQNLTQKCQIDSLVYVSISPIDYFNAPQ